MSSLSHVRSKIARSALTVTSKRPDDLRQADNQLRRHSKRQVKQLAHRPNEILVRRGDISLPHSRATAASKACV